METSAVRTPPHRGGRAWRKSLPALVIGPLLLLASLGALHAGAAPSQVAPPVAPPSVIDHVVAQVSTDGLESSICHLQDADELGYCNTEGSRYSYNSAGLREAAAYITGQLGQYDQIEVVTQTFSLNSAGPNQFAPANIIGTLPGVALSDQRGVVIISAHYDSTSGAAEDGGPAPGADDNASGVAAVLESARLLQAYTFRHTIRFITFAGEEQGLYGSRAYAAEARARGDDILAVINADMVGYNSDGSPHMEIHAGAQARNLAVASAVTRTIAFHHLDLLPRVITTGATGRSDHSSFWDRGYPAVLVIEDTDIVGPTDDFNPSYHSVDDTLDKLDRDFLTEMVCAIVGAAARLAEPTGPDLEITQVGPDSAVAGQTVALTLSYTNAGTTAAAGVVLTDTLSNGLIYQSDSSGFARAFDAAGRVVWDIGEIGPGSSGAFVVTATVRSDVAVDTRLRSTGVVAGSPLEADSLDNLSIWEIGVIQRQRVYLPLIASDE